MNKSKHTTKSGPGRRHVDGEYRNGKMHRLRSAMPHGEPGDKLRRKAMMGTLGR